MQILWWSTSEWEEAGKNLSKRDEGVVYLWGKGESNDICYWIFPSNVIYKSKYPFSFSHIWQMTKPRTGKEISALFCTLIVMDEIIRRKNKHQVLYFQNKICRNVFLYSTSPPTQFYEPHKYWGYGHDLNIYKVAPHSLVQIKIKWLEILTWDVSEVLLLYWWSLHNEEHPSENRAISIFNFQLYYFPLTGRQKARYICFDYV